MQDNCSWLITHWYLTVNILLEILLSVSFFFFLLSSILNQVYLLQRGIFHARNSSYGVKTSGEVGNTYVSSHNKVFKHLFESTAPFSLRSCISLIP